jgi:DNA-binding Lrp family transcriptional regulator
LGVYLDLIDMARDGGDVLGPLIEAAVFEANVADFVEGHHRAGALWALAGPVPAEAMRPASVNAVAASLRLPFETVRRRVAALVGDGRLVRDRDGLGVAPEWLVRPAALELSRRRCARLQRIHRDILERLGPAALELPPAPAAPAEPPLLLTDHLANGYMLRAAELVTAELGDPFVGFVLLNLVRANIRHLPLEDSGFARASVAARRPARPSPLAKTLGVAPETLRRHVRRLETAGYLVRTADGGMLLDEQLFRSRLAHVLIGVGVASIRRILGEMAQAGLLPAAGEPGPHGGASGLAANGD